MNTIDFRGWTVYQGPIPAARCDADGLSAEIDEDGDLVLSDGNGGIIIPVEVVQEMLRRDGDRRAGR